MADNFQTSKQSGDENAQRTEMFIGSFVQVRAKELNSHISDSQVREITNAITGKLTPEQRSGVASINMGDVSGSIDAELRRQSDTNRPVNMFSAEAARIDAQNGSGRWGQDAGLLAAAMLRGRGGDGDSGSGEPGSSRRYESIGTLNETQRQALDLARKVGLDWAANNPDLLRLGPSAIRALADVHLQKESYDRFKNGGLDAKAIVAGARYAKKNGVDYNEASKAFEDAHQSLAPADRKAHTDAVTKFNKSAGKPNATPAEEEAAKKEFNQSMDGLIERNPTAKKAIERQQRILKTVKEQEHAATAKADVKTTTANTKTNVADEKAKTATKDVVAKQATKSRLLSSLD